MAGVQIRTSGWDQMPGRVAQLWQRYRARHHHQALGAFPLHDGAGQVIGHVERAIIRQGRAEVSGWARADRVGLRGGAGTRWVTPALLREDVARASGQAALVQSGFRLDLPHDQGPLSIVVERPGEALVVPIPRASVLGGLAERFRLARSFLAALLRSVPDARLALRTGSPEARARIRNRLGLGTVPEAGVLDPAVFAATRARANALSPVTIILPVFNAFDLLPQALSRLVMHTDLPWHLILIEDCSTDARVRPFLADWVAAQDKARPGGTTLIENDRNLGFIGAANRGLAAALGRGNHVILLNSDAFVPAGWASRLLRPILHSADVASVTPLSNDAEICTVPVISRRGPLATGDVDRIDAVARQLDECAAQAIGPTGVGFCMAMNIGWLRCFPAFDPAFGRGYGEEVDWCQKVGAAGGRHVLTGGLFVEHGGGASFGAEQKARAVQANSALISNRYRGFDVSVHDFIAKDPLLTSRLALALAWAGCDAAAENPVPVYLAHSLGGGAETWLGRRIARDLEDRRGIVVIRVGGADRWQIEVHGKTGVIRGRTSDTALLLRMMNALPSRRLVYSCGVGDSDPLGLPAILAELCARPDDQLEVLFHDFFPLAPSYTLLDAAGRFRGVPASDSPDPAFACKRSDGSRAGLARWRAEWGGLLAKARRITVFSDDSRAHVLAAYPFLAPRIVVNPHVTIAPPDAQAEMPPTGTDPIIGVLGNIGFHKGAAVLVELSRRLKAGTGCRLVVIGNVDPAFVLSPPARIHGDYQPRDIPHLVRRHGITQWLIPSIWPETFSFTTHEAIATGLPVWAFDLGAQGMAVKEAAARTGRGGVLPLEDGQPDFERLIKALTGGAGPR